MPGQRSRIQVKKFACFGTLLIALSGCASVEQEAASYAKADALACMDYGARPGTKAYYECRMTKNREHEFNAQVEHARRQQASEDLMVIGAQMMQQ
jgi:hypothetical protein